MFRLVPKESLQVCTGMLIPIHTTTRFVRAVSKQAPNCSKWAGSTLRGFVPPAICPVQQQKPWGCNSLPSEKMSWIVKYMWHNNLSLSLKHVDTLYCSGVHTCDENVCECQGVTDNKFWTVNTTRVRVIMADNSQQASPTYFFLVHNSVIDVECSYVFSCTQIGNFSSQKLNHHYTYVKAQKDKTSIESTDEDRSF